MKYTEFERWLKEQGVQIDKKRGKGSHRLATYGDKSTTYPFHKGKEMKEGMRKAIIEQLGL
ncbi:type II toxin-antitoxin system HicA family toxin [Moraxella sp. ZY200743]|uniref:type II toxin-antitoxin system HicA family toxin n=1 Tax=Moraxella sp. ZY200743 TaxID=2911970 RepID=UPI003D7D076C